MASMSQACVGVPEHISKVAEILAAGIIRAKRRQFARMENNRSFSETGLDFSLDSSVHSMKPITRGENL